MDPSLLKRAFETLVPLATTIEVHATIYARLQVEASTTYNISVAAHADPETVDRVLSSLQTLEIHGNAKPLLDIALNTHVLSTSTPVAESVVRPYPSQPPQPFPPQPPGGPPPPPLPPLRPPPPPSPPIPPKTPWSLFNSLDSPLQPKCYSRMNDVIRTGTISASSVYASDIPEYVQSDPLDQYWSSSSDLRIPQWIQLDFGTPRPACKVVLDSRGKIGVPGRLSIFTSDDGVTFTEQGEEIGTCGQSTFNLIASNPLGDAKRHRIVRLQFHAHARCSENNNTFIISKFSVVGRSDMPMAPPPAPLSPPSPGSPPPPPPTSPSPSPPTPSPPPPVSPPPDPPSTSPSPSPPSPPNLPPVAPSSCSEMAVISNRSELSSGEFETCAEVPLDMCVHFYDQRHQGIVTPCEIWNGGCVGSKLVACPPPLPPSPPQPPSLPPPTPTSPPWHDAVATIAPLITVSDTEPTTTFHCGSLLTCVSQNGTLGTWYNHTSHGSTCGDLIDALKSTNMGEDGLMTPLQACANVSTAYPEACAGCAPMAESVGCAAFQDMGNGTQISGSLSSAAFENGTFTASAAFACEECLRDPTGHCAGFTFLSSESTGSATVELRDGTKTMTTQFGRHAFLHTSLVTSPSPPPTNPTVSSTAQCAELGFQKIVNASSTIGLGGNLLVSYDLTTADTANVADCCRRCLETAPPSAPPQPASPPFATICENSCDDWNEVTELDNSYAGYLYENVGGENGDGIVNVDSECSGCWKAWLLSALGIDENLCLACRVGEHAQTPTLPYTRNLPDGRKGFTNNSRCEDGLTPEVGYTSNDVPISTNSKRAQYYVKLSNSLPHDASFTTTRGGTPSSRTFFANHKNAYLYWPCNVGYDCADCGPRDITLGRRRMENHHTLPSPLDEVWLEKMASHFNNQTVSFVLPPKHVFMIRTRAFIQKNGRSPTFEETTTIASDILGEALVYQLLTKGLSVAITENYQTRQKRKLDALQKRGRELVEASGRCLGVSIDDLGCRLHDSTHVLTNGSSSEVYILTHTPQTSPPPLPLAASPSPQPPQPPHKPPLIPPLPPNTPVQIPHPPNVPLGPRSPPKPPVAPGYVFDEFTVTVELALTSEPHVLLDAAVSNAIRRILADATRTDLSKVVISFKTFDNSVKASSLANLQNKSMSFSLGNHRRLQQHINRLPHPNDRAFIRMVKSGLHNGTIAKYELPPSHTKAIELYDLENAGLNPIKPSNHLRRRLVVDTSECARANVHVVTATITVPTLADSDAVSGAVVNSMRMRNHVSTSENSPVYTCSSPIVVSTDRILKERAPPTPSSPQASSGNIASFLHAHSHEPPVAPPPPSPLPPPPPPRPNAPPPPRPPPPLLRFQVASGGWMLVGVAIVGTGLAVVVAREKGGFAKAVRLENAE